MPFSPLDSLMQIAAPARSVEPPPRRDGGNSFRPALENAYRSETPRSATPTEQAPPKSTGDEQPSTRERDDAEQYPQEAPVAESAAAPAEAPDDRQEESTDAIAVSAEGAAAAAASVVNDAAAADGEAIAKTQNADSVLPAKATPDKEPNGDLPGEASSSENQESGESDTASTAATPVQEKQAELSQTSSKSSPQQPHNEENDEIKPVSSQKQAGQHAHNASLAAEEEKAQTTTDPGDELLPQESDAVDGVDDSTSAELQDNPTERPSETREDKRSESKFASHNPTPSSSATPETAPQAAGDAQLLRAAFEAVDAVSDAAATSPVEAAATREQAPRASGTLDRLLTSRTLQTGKESGEADGTPHVDRARFVQRVEGAMRTAQQRDGRVQVRLNPPELGSLKIELALQNGVLAAKLEAETPAARNLLLDSLPALRDRLAQQDIQIEKFDVDVRRDGGDDASRSGGDERMADQPNDQPNNRSRSTPSRRMPMPSIETARPTIASAPSAGIDIRV